MAQERLQKILAQAGIGSRRECEKWISEGRVRVQGRVVTELGTRADPRRDKIEVDGQRITVASWVHFIFNKPRGVVCTLSDPEGRPALSDYARNIPERVFPVGRLDFHTSGALLLTNDGQMADALLRPAAQVPKVYIVKMDGHLDVPTLDRLRNGVTLDDGYVTRPCELFVDREEPGHTWVQITLTEGKNRQIHRMAEAVGHRVMRLSRLSFAGMTTEGLRPGKFRQLKARELEKLTKKYLRPARQAAKGTHRE